MEFDLKNILFLLFILLPLIQRIFGKKPQQAPETERPAEVQRGREPLPQAETDEVDWEKELERLFGKTGGTDETAARQADRIEYQPEPEDTTEEKVAEPVATTFETFEPATVKENREPVRVKETFQEYRVPVQPRTPLQIEHKEGRADAFTYHKPESLHALHHDSGVRRTRSKNVFSEALKDRKQLQQAIVLAEILQRRRGPHSR